MNAHHQIPAYAFSLFSGKGIGYSSSFNQMNSLLPKRSYGQARLNYAVNFATGNLIAHDRNINVTDTGNSINFSYIYNSQTTNPATAWKLKVGRKINIDSITSSWFFKDTLTVTEADGHLSEFTLDADGKYYGAAIQGSRPCIKINKDSKTYSWFHPKTRTTELFDSLGNLTKRIELAGNETSFEYDENTLLKAVIAPSGARYEIRRSGSEVKVVLVNTSREEILIHTYTFDNGNLTSSTTPDGYAIQYLYDETGKIKSVTQSDSSALQFGFYSDTNKLQSIQLGNDEKQNINNFTYKNDTTVLLDGSNVETTFNVDEKNTITTSQNNDSKNTDITKRFHTQDGLISKIIYPDQSAEQFEYQDKTGLITNHIHRNGTSTKYLYDDKNNPNLVTAKIDYSIPDEKKQINPLGKTQYVYDTAVNSLLRYEITPEGFVKEYSYNAKNLIETIREFPKNKFISDDKPLTLAQLDAWRNDAKRLSESKLEKLVYNDQGRLAKTVRFTNLDEKYNGIENASSTEEKLEYNTLGYLTKHQKKFAGSDDTTQYKTSAYQYNDNGNITVEKVGVDTRLEQTTQYQYTGKEIAIQYPNQTIKTKQYNSQNLLGSITTAVTIDPKSSIRNEKIGTSTKFYPELSYTVNHVVSKPIAPLKSHNTNSIRYRAARAWGVLGAVLGSFTVLATLVLGITFLAVPVVGWALLAISCFAACVGIGIGVVKYKNKSLPRKNLVKDVKETNATLDATHKKTEFTKKAYAVSRQPDEKNIRTKTFERDTSGRVVAEVGADKKKIINYYDNQNRIKYTVTPKGSVTEYEYNREFNYQSKTEYYDCIDQSQNGKPEGVAITPGKDRTSHTFYYPNEQVRYQIDADGYLVESFYNDLEKLTCEIRYSQKLSDDDLIKLQQGNSNEFKPNRNIDRIANYFYDKDGNKISEQGPNEYITQFKRDAAGRLIEEIHFANKLQVTKDNFIAICLAENTAKDSHHYYFYNSLDQCVMEVDAEEAITEHTFSADGNQQSSKQYYNRVSADWQDKTIQPIPVVSDKDQATNYFYDELLRLSKKITASGAITTYTYDEMNHRTATTIEDAKNQQRTPDKISDNYRASEKKFDGWGQVVASADPLVMERIAKISLNNISDLEKKTAKEKVWQDNSERNQYNEMGLKIKSTDQLGRHTFYYYDEDKNPIISIDATGIVTENKYNTFGEVIDVYAYYNRITADNLATLKGGYIDDPIRRLIIEDAKKDSHTIQERDRRGLITTLIKPSGATTQYTYNAYKECEVETTPNYSNASTLIVTHEYDTKGTETKTTKQSGDQKITVQNEYNSQNKLIQHTNERGALTIFTTDRLGRITEVKKEETKDNFITDQQVKFDTFSRPIEIINADNQKTTIEYNNDGRLEEHKSAAQETKLSLTKNIFDEVIESRYADNNLQTFKHSADGQVATKQAGDAISSTEYNLKGLVGTITTASRATTTFRYNNSDQVESKTVSDQKNQNLITTFTPNAHGKNEKIVDARKIETKNEFDRGGNLAKATRDPNGRALTAEYGHNTQDQLETTTLGDTKNPDQMKTKNIYDGFNRVIAEITDHDGLNISKQYEYDASNNRTKEIDPNGNITRKYYDLLNRKRFEVKPLDDKQVYATEWDYTKTGKVKSVRTYKPLDSKLVDDQTNFDSVQKSLQLDNKNDNVTLHYYDGYDRPTFDIVLAYDAFTAKLQAIVEEKQYDKTDRQIKKIKYSKALDASQYSEWTTDLLLKKVAVDMKDDNKAQTIQSYYDNQSRECFAINQDGKVSEKRYDAVGRVITEIHYAKPLKNIDNKKTEEISALLQNQLDPTRDRCTYRVYDFLNREIFTISPDNSVIRKDYDENNNIVRICKFKEFIKPQANYAALVDVVSGLVPDEKTDTISESKYDIDNLLEKLTDAYKNTDKYYRDAIGSIYKHTDRANQDWGYKFDRAKRLVEESSPKTTIATAIKDAKGKYSIKEDITTVTSKTTYDNAGNTKSVTQGILEGKTDEEKLRQARTVELLHSPLNTPVGTIQNNISINDETKSASLIDAPVKQVTLSTNIIYNTFGKKLVEKNEAGGYQFYVYDNVGRLIFEIDREQAVTQHIYSGLDKPSFTIKYATRSTADLSNYYATGLTPEVALSSLGLNAKHPNNRMTEYSYNPSGTVETIKSGPVFYYADGKFGVAQPETKIQTNLLRDCICESKLISPNTYASKFTWLDLCGRVIAEVNERSFLTRYIRNAAGDIIRKTEYAIPLSEAVELNTIVEQLDKLVEPSDKDHVYSYEYNLLGKKITETLQKEDTQKLVLDEKNKPQLQTTAKKDLTRKWEYNAIEKPIKLTYEDGATERTFYNEAGNVIASTGIKRTSLDKDGKSIVLTPVTLAKINAHGDVIATQSSMKGGVLFDDKKSTPVPIIGLIVGSEKDLIQTITPFDNRGLINASQDPENNLKTFTHTPNRKIAREISQLTTYEPNVLKKDIKHDPSKKLEAKLTFKSVTHVDEKQVAYDKNNLPIKTSFLRDNKVEQETYNQFNAFREMIGEGSDNKTWDHNKKIDTQGKVWLTNNANGATISAYDLRGAETLKLQSTDVDLSNKDYADLPDLVSADDARFERTEIQRDAEANIVTQKSPIWFRDKKVQPTRTFAHDHWKNVISEADSLGNKTEYEFNLRNQLKKTTQPEVDVVVIDAGKVIFAENGNFLRKRPVILHGYNDRGAHVGTTDANNHTHGVLLDEANQLLSTVLADGVKDKTQVLNAVGHTVSLSNSLGNTWYFDTDRNGNIFANHSPSDFRNRKYEYDEANQRHAETNILGDTTYYNHDARGNITDAYLPLGHRTSIIWDRNSQPVFVTNPDGSTDEWQRNYFGLPVKHTQTHSDRTAHVTEYLYNFSNKLYKQSLLSGASWQASNLLQTCSYAPEDAKHEYPATNFSLLVTSSSPQKIVNEYKYGSLATVLDVGLNKLSQYETDTESRRTSVSIMSAPDKSVLYKITTLYDELNRESLTTDIRRSETNLEAKMTSQPKYDAAGNCLNLTTIVTPAPLSTDCKPPSHVRPAWSLVDEADRVTLSDGALIPYDGSKWVAVIPGQGVAMTYDNNFRVYETKIDRSGSVTVAKLQYNTSGLFYASDTAYLHAETRFTARGYQSYYVENTTKNEKLEQLAQYNENDWQVGFTDITNNTQTDITEFHPSGNPLKEVTNDKKNGNVDKRTNEYLPTDPGALTKVSATRTNKNGTSPLATASFCHDANGVINGKIGSDDELTERNEQSQVYYDTTTEGWTLNKARLTGDRKANRQSNYLRNINGDLLAGYTSMTNTNQLSMVISDLVFYDVSSSYVLAWLTAVFKGMNVTNGIIISTSPHPDFTGWVGFIENGVPVADKWRIKLFDTNYMVSLGCNMNLEGVNYVYDRSRNNGLFDDTLDKAYRLKGSSLALELQRRHLANHRNSVGSDFQLIMTDIAVTNVVHPIGRTTPTNQGSKTLPLDWDEPNLLQNLGPQTYIVKPGDTFKSISKRFAGNTRSADKIALYNNFTSLKHAPKPGYILQVPQLIQSRNQANSARPDEEFLRVISGKLVPRLITPVPPPQPTEVQHQHHSLWKDIIKVIAVAAVCIAAPHLAGPLLAVSGVGALFAGTTTASALLAATTGVIAAVGDAAVQGVAVHFHMQNFSVAEMLETGFTAGMSTTLRDGELVENALKIGASNVTMQLGEMGAGIRDKFDLSAAVVQVSAYIASVKINQGIDALAQDHVTVANVAKNISDNTASAVLGKTITKTPINVRQLVTNAVGNQIGDEAGSRFVNSDAVQSMLAPKQNDFNTDINTSDPRWSAKLSDIASQQRQAAQAMQDGKATSRNYLADPARQAYMRNMMFADSRAALSLGAEETKSQAYKAAPKQQSSSAKVLSGLSSQSSNSRGFWQQQLDTINTAHLIEKQMATEYYSKLKQDLNEVLNGEFKASSLKELAGAGAVTASFVFPPLRAVARSNVPLFDIMGGLGEAQAVGVPVSKNIGLTSRLNRTQISDYLANVHTLSREQLVGDIESIGFTLKGESPNGLFKTFEDKVGNLRIKIHPADASTDSSHMHIYDRAGSSLTPHLTRAAYDSPDVHIRIEPIQKELEWRLQR